MSLLYLAGYSLPAIAALMRSEDIVDHVPDLEQVLIKYLLLAEEHSSYDLGTKTVLSKHIELEDSDDGRKIDLESFLLYCDANATVHLSDNSNADNFVDSVNTCSKESGSDKSEGLDSDSRAENTDSEVDVLYTKTLVEDVLVPDFLEDNGQLEASFKETTDKENEVAETNVSELFDLKNNIDIEQTTKLTFKYAKMLFKPMIVSLNMHAINVKHESVSFGQQCLLKFLETNKQIQKFSSCKKIITQEYFQVKLK